MKEARWRHGRKSGRGEENRRQQSRIAPGPQFAQPLHSEQFVKYVDAKVIVRYVSLALVPTVIKRVPSRSQLSRCPTLSCWHWSWPLVCVSKSGRLNHLALRSKLKSVDRRTLHKLHGCAIFLFYPLTHPFLPFLQLFSRTTCATQLSDLLLDLFQVIALSHRPHPSLRLLLVPLDHFPSIPQKCTARHDSH